MAALPPPHPPLTRPFLSSLVDLLTPRLPQGQKANTVAVAMAAVEAAAGGDVEAALKVLAVEKMQRATGSGGAAARGGGRGGKGRTVAMSVGAAEWAS